MDAGRNFEKVDLGFEAYGRVNPNSWNQKTSPKKKRRKKRKKR